jgi:hypothetical protein
VVEVGSLVENLCGIRENQESVGKSLRNPEEFEGVGFEMEAGPFAEVGGVTAEVDGNVPYVAGKNTDELSLGAAELIVEAS